MINKIKGILIFFTFITVQVLTSLGALGDSMPVPAKLQTALFVKIFEYDRTLKGKIKVGILQGAESGEIKENFTAIAGDKFSISVISAGSIGSEGVNVVYIPPGSKGLLGNIAKICADKGILTITGVPEYVEEGMVSVGIGIKENKKPEIIVNLSRLKTENHDISSQLLKLAKIIK